ncbi:MAG TPA: EF-Tu/IF-2/RF-3 family GTPase, partial [Oligoflexia bacterium]|nr:EF-Tu/IF-2/RF-3 family GTPase [Oligoflexia bacterium]
DDEDGGHAAGRHALGGGPLTLERFSEMISESTELKELPLIVKADVQGSVEAVSGALAQLSNEEVKVKILHRGVGAVGENDVQLAAASRAIIVGFNVRPDARANDLIEAEGVQLLYSRVIYELVDLVENALRGRMSPKFQEKTLGRVEVRQTFRIPKQGTIAGSYVLDGVVHRGSFVRLLRDGVVMYEGKMSSLRRFKDDVREVAAGYECGIGLEGFSDIKDGDVIEVYKVEQIEP